MLLKSSLWPVKTPTKCTYLRNVRGWRPQLIPHNLLTINYLKLAFPIFTSSQSKLRLNTFVKCREIFTEITKKSFGPQCEVKLPLNSYKNTILPIWRYQSQTQRKEIRFVRTGSDRWRLLEGFFSGKSSAGNLQRWDVRSLSFRVWNGFPHK